MAVLEDLGECDRIYVCVNEYAKENKNEENGKDWHTVTKPKKWNRKQIPT